jgi:hypothetical protein
VPPRSKPSVSKLIMPRLLRPSAGISSFGPTLCRLTARGTAMPCSFPSVLIHVHRALWMWPAIMRTVRRGAPGTVTPHSSWGKCSTRKTVTRLLVLHAASSISLWSSAECITTLQRNEQARNPRRTKLVEKVAITRSPEPTCWATPRDTTRLSASLAAGQHRSCSKGNKKRGQCGDHRPEHEREKVPPVRSV